MCGARLAGLLLLCAVSRGSCLGWGLWEPTLTYYTSSGCSGSSSSRDVDSTCTSLFGVGAKLSCSAGGTLSASVCLSSDCSSYCGSAGASGELMGCLSIGSGSFKSSCQFGIGMYLLIAACVVTVVCCCGCCCCRCRGESNRERLEAAVDSSRDELTGLLRDQARALTRKKELLERQEALVMEQSRLVQRRCGGSSSRPSSRESGRSHRRRGRSGVTTKTRSRRLPCQCSRTRAVDTTPLSPRFFFWSAMGVHARATQRPRSTRGSTALTSTRRTRSASGRRGLSRRSAAAVKRTR